MDGPGAGWLQQFRTSLGFELDEFQIEACRYLEDGRNVLVSAPTGAGKTIVGEFAVFRALQQGDRVFYTAPIKALGNQKFKELRARFGVDKVGLLTGDISVNPGASAVVMTTEVLRNMLYARPEGLAGLAAVVMDEAHYLSDPVRGGAWEEVIIHLPPEVRLVALSATISNPEEVGAWLGSVHGRTSVVVSEDRPAPLFHHVMAGRQIFDLFRPVALDAGPVNQAGGTASDFAELNPNLLALVRARHGSAGSDDEAAGRRRTRQFDRQRDPDRGRARGVAWGVVARGLTGAGYLPAIAFVFSQAGCDAAVRACVDAGVRLARPDARRRIDQEIDEMARQLPPEDLAAANFEDWRRGLRCGVAAHHAGMLPVFKATVEQLFAAGLLGVVFATETLALGINMPAKAVVLERLEKFNGQEVLPLTAAEYTQLTGRAGRRGIDTEGHAITLWRPGMDPTALADLATGASLPVISGFRPNYNMCINLITRHGLEGSRRLVQSSLAQFQSRDAADHGRNERQPDRGTTIRLPGSLVESHDRVIDVLAHYGYLRRSADGTAPTAKGQRLRTLHGESGLLVSLTLDSGAFDSLTAAELAVFATVFVYRSASSGQRGHRRMPEPRLEEAFNQAINSWAGLQLTEERNGLPTTPEPDTGLVHAMHLWASGGGLQETLNESSDLTAGAFAYWANRCVNLLDQLARAEHIPAGLGPRCEAAAALIERGAVKGAAAAD